MNFPTSCFSLLDDSTALPDHPFCAGGDRNIRRCLQPISKRATLSKRFLKTA
jgi:hypothetical protein